ncbi:hypothetical protein D3C85_1916870 [compost metagenome]
MLTHCAAGCLQLLSHRRRPLREFQVSHLNSAVNHCNAVRHLSGQFQYSFVELPLRQRLPYTVHQVPLVELPRGQ